MLRVFDLNVAVTVLNEKPANKAGIDVDFAYVILLDKVGQLLFEVPTGRILGAQAVGKGNVNKRIDIISAMIMTDGTLEDLKVLKLCYSPLLGTSRDVNQAAMAGLNLLNRKHRQVPVFQVRKLVEKGAVM